jgi:hypothetical protein
MMMFAPSSAGAKTMVGPGNWHVELDDGEPPDKHADVDGAVLLLCGERLPGTLYGRRWRIVRVYADKKYAVAVPDE